MTLEDVLFIGIIDDDDDDEGIDDGHEDEAAPPPPPALPALAPPVVCVDGAPVEGLLWLLVLAAYSLILMLIVVLCW